MAKNKPFNGKALGELLSKVHLGGLVEDCVLTVHNNIGTIQSIDISNSIFIDCKKDLGDVEDMVLGLSGLTILCKYTGDEGELFFSVKDKKLVLHKRGHGKLKLTLLQPDEVPTAVREKDVKKNILEHSSYLTPLTDKAIKNLLYYLELVHPDSMVFQIKKGSGAVIGTTNAISEQQFNTRVGKSEELPEEDIECEVYTKHLSAVLKELDANDSATLRLGDKAPIIIEQNGCLWALTPIIA